MLLATPAIASGPYGFADSKLNAEFEKNYHEHRYPNWVIASGSSATLTYATISTGTFVQINATTGTVQSFMVAGTTTNDNAPTGRIGELIEAQQTSGVTAAASGSYKEVANIVLTAGDWDISCTVNVSAATTTSFTGNGQNEVLIATASAATTGTTFGHDRFIWAWQTTWVPGAVNAYTASIARKRVSLSASQTYYLNMLLTYTSTAPTLYGTISARRIR